VGTIKRLPQLILGTFLTSAGLSHLGSNRQAFQAQVPTWTAIFFVLIFPGNINQYVNGIDAFGLDTDQKRLIRLFFQPLLVLWALWASGGLNHFRDKQR
jgi:hypothetical protein